MGKADLFRDANINDRIRSFLRVELGWDAEEVEKLKNRNLELTLLEEERKERQLERDMQDLPKFIAAGLITQHESDEMSRFELRDFASKARALMSLMKQAAPKATKESKDAVKKAEEVSRQSPSPP